MPKSKTVEKLIAEENKLVRVMNAKYRAFDELVKKELNKVGLKKLKTDAKAFNEFKNKLPRLMRKAGLGDIAYPIKTQLKDIENIALLELEKDMDKLLTAVDVRNSRQVTLEGVTKQNRIVFADQEKTFRQKFTQKNFKQINSKTDFNQFMKSLTKGSKAKIETIARTTVQVHDNITVTNKANELGLTKFRYAGANDSKNRPFCSSRVGRTFTDEEAEKWDNGQISPASDTLGGYNCRHRKRYLIE